MSVDSYKYLDFLTRQMVASWISMAEPASIPWTPLSKPLSDSTVALISSGGIALKTDKPFDQEGERRNPWWGDSSWQECAKSLFLHGIHTSAKNLS